MVAELPTAEREAFLARLTTTAYQVALRHGIRGSFAELELDLWHELRAVCAAEKPAEGAREWPR